MIPVENENFHRYTPRLEYMLKRINPKKYGYDPKIHSRGRKTKPWKLTPHNRALLEEYYIDKLNEGITKPRILSLLEQTSRILEWLEKDWDKVTIEDLKIIVSKIRSNPHTEKTKSDYLCKIKQFDKWANKNKDYTDKTKWIKTTIRLKHYKLPNDLITPKEAQQLIDATITARDRAIISLLWETGARVGEIANLKLQDIQFNKGDATINLFGKTGARRVMILESVRDLKNYLTVRNLMAKHDFVFCLEGTRNKSAPMTHPSIIKLLKQATTRANLNKRTYPHLFRHSRASYLASKGLSEAQLCFIFGWALGSKQVRTYIHLSQQQVQDTLLEKVYGIKKVETHDQEVVKCFVCGEINQPNTDTCVNCYNPLTIQGALKIKQQNEILEQDRDISQKVMAEAFKLIQNKSLTTTEAQKQAIQIVAQQQVQTTKKETN
jgi:site-specific recombinase XerD